MRVGLAVLVVFFLAVAGWGPALAQQGTCAGGRFPGISCSSNGDCPGGCGGQSCLTNGTCPLTCSNDPNINCPSTCRFCINNHNIPCTTASQCVSVGGNCSIAGTCTSACNNPVPGVCAPAEVDGLNWCPGTKDCLAWSAAPGATEYRLYKGSFGSLPDLLTTNADSCRVSTLTTTTQSGLSDEPEPCGGVFWYLVTAANGGTEGPSGNATAQARTLNAPGACQPALCLVEGEACTASGSCCSGSCVEGTCSTACCVGASCFCGYYSITCAGACANTATDTANCGGCGLACSSNHATPRCTSGTCNGNCASGFGDCDNNRQSNGCETNIASDLSNCGVCGRVCSSNHVTPQCTVGICDGACAAGFDDCNNNKRTDGCEISTQTSSTNCGGCGIVCSSSHVTPQCTGGVCDGACAAGFADCNNNKRTDGCETNITSDPNHCSNCGTICSSNHVTPQCTGGACDGACASGFADCDNNKQTNGCEISTQTSSNNCGGCGIVCSSNHVTPQCTGGTCNGACGPGFADCNNNKQTDGCEISTNTDPNHCGNCAAVCSGNHIPNRTCGGGTCTGICAPPFADCNNNKLIDGCEVNTNTDRNNCGSCGFVCTGLMQNCINGTCSF